MFYKVENSQLIEAPKNGIKVFIANPTPEQYALVGYTDKAFQSYAITLSFHLCCSFRNYII
jgi:hypothetical protein